MPSPFTTSLYRWSMAMILACGCASTFTALAAEPFNVMTEGTAQIANGDLPLAREIATQRALTRAAESAGFAIHAETTLDPEGGITESAHIRTEACIRHYATLYEHVGPDTVTVMLDVSVDPGGKCMLQCAPAYPKHVLVTGFAFEFPEHLRFEENVRLERLIAHPLANAIGAYAQINSTAFRDYFPYRIPALAPETTTGVALDRPPLVVTAAETARAQYLLSGVFRNFAISQSVFGHGTRHIEVEAFLHDGFEGSVVARHTFGKTVHGAILLKEAPRWDSAASNGTAIEKALSHIVSEIAAWAASEVECRRLIGRITQTDGMSIRLDLGADAGLAVGDTLTLHARQTYSRITPGSPPTRALGTAIVRHIAQDSITAQVIGPSAGQMPAAGDLAYTR